MPYCNRVDPGGTLHAVPERGLFFGNRGCIHNASGQIRRKPPVDRWIICVTEFKARRRKLLQPGHYTELFFLDEPTALAAGHRPCFECRRKAANHFRMAMTDARVADHLSADDIDQILKPERARGLDDPTRHVSCEEASSLPDGVMLRGRNGYLLKSGQALLPWSFGGYGAGRPIERFGADALRLVTPPATVSALSAGYMPVFHTSAGRPPA